MVWRWGSAIARMAVWALAVVGCNGAHGTPAHLQTDPMQVLRAQQAPVASVRAIRAEARIDQRGEGGRIRGTVFMFAQRLASVRVDAMSQFGPVSILTSNGETFALSDFREKRFIVGPACPRNVARLLRMPMTPEQTVEFLLGGTALIDAADRTMRWDAERGRYVIELRSAEGYHQVLRLSLRGGGAEAPLAEQRFDLRSSELRDPAGKRLWRVTLDDHQSVDDGGRRIRWPFRVHVVQPESDLDTLIRFKKITVNPQVPAAAFIQKPAGGMRVEEAPCD